MPDPWRSELSWMWSRCRGRFRSAQALSLAFKAVNLILLAPVSAAILRFCLSRWGRASVGNFELIWFFTSPIGLVAILSIGSILLALQYLELSGLIRLLADDRLHWWQALSSSTQLLPRLVRLGLRQLAVYLALAIPFLVGIGLVYWQFWHGRDLNGLIILKPPAFWWGAGLAGGVAAIYLLLAAVLFIRWIYAVPVLTLELATPARALAASNHRARTTFWRCTVALVLWFISQAALSASLLGIVQFASQILLARASQSLTLAALQAGIVVVANAVAGMLVGVVGNVALAAVILALYRHVAPSEALPSERPESPPRVKSAVGWVLGTALVAIAVLSPAVSFLAIRQLRLEESLEITAHRAGAAHAPENTVAALMQATADRADWAEIDVQLTADKQIVVMHDIDLARVGGGNRGVDQATLAEIQALDVGANFGLSFAGERIPTLSALLTAARGKIRLNVELKPHGTSDAGELTRRVIAELRTADMVPQCRLCSQSYESLQLARQIEPHLEVGFIVATSIGDLAQLDVNFLMVKSSQVTRSLVDRARLKNIAVHAWTVNDPAEVAPLLDAGIANLITDDPARIRIKLDEIRGLSSIERLLLRTRNSLSQ